MELRIAVVDVGTPVSAILDWMDACGLEFCLAAEFSRELLERYAYEGFFPVTGGESGLPFLHLKMHRQRSLLDFEDLHVGKSVLRRLPRYDLVVDQDFDACLAKAAAFHEETWLTRELVDLLSEIHDNPSGRLRVHSVELLRGGSLVAGEIGYSLGACYTSLSGFRLESGAGSVQLAMLGGLLKSRGFAFWDLGMDIPYKTALGAHLHARSAFLERFHAVRDVENISLV